VRPGASTGAYTNLLPRQPLSSTPYALHALSVPAANLSGTVPDTLLSTNVVLASAANHFRGDQTITEGSLGIGTTTPGGKLEVSGEVVIGDSTVGAPRAGTMRWTGSDFEGYNGTEWVSLTLPVLSSAVVPVTNMVYIQPGSFAMGSPASEVDRSGDEGPQTTVTISRGFWMGIYEVTQWEYTNVTGLANPSYFGGDVNRPVERVYWVDATNYCARLTSRERGAGRIPSGYVYRLPTEAEWEYVCRAGTSTRFSHGNDTGYLELGNYAWYNVNSGNTTHPVGGKGANPWGLYDMHGNVWEWCQDWYGGYPGGVVSDPTGPASGSDRVFRGGGWTSDGRYCRSAPRKWLSPTSRINFIGFRVVLAPVQ